MNVKKDLKPLFKRAREQGFQIELRRKYRVTAPTGEVFGCAVTPSDHLALKRIKADFRRHGLEL
jgi:hypothetical protein